MSGNIGNGMANPFKNMLMVLALGLMLACGTAYAAEPASPAPVTATKDKMSQAQSSNKYDPVSADMGDKIFDWGIVFCIVILGLLVSINFWDSRKDDLK